MTPLNLYLDSATPEEVEDVVREYGDTIRDLAIANVFAGDMLWRNFGVNRHGRVVFYDYDEIEYLTDCSFRIIPPPPNPEAELSGEPWYPVGALDVFPEEFETFLLGSPQVREAFMRHHADLLRPEFWQRCQEQVGRGEIVDFFPYPENVRFSWRFPSGEVGRRRHYDRRVEPLNTPESEEPAAPVASRGRARAGMASARGQVERVTARAQAERQRHQTVDTLFDMADHDSEVGGESWPARSPTGSSSGCCRSRSSPLPGSASTPRRRRARPRARPRRSGSPGWCRPRSRARLRGSARWYAILIGIPLLVYTTRSVLRALIVTHRLVWNDERGMVPKPTLGATLQLLAAFVGYLAFSVLASGVRGASFTEGLLVTLLIPIPYAALWLAISMRLPHRNATWRDLVPGAIVFGLGVEVLHVVIAYFIAPQASSKQGTYGSLGIAAALLLGLYLISRLVVATAVLNATLVRRRERSSAAAS